MAAGTVTLRTRTQSGATTKGSRLTHEELDDNFLFLQSGTGAVARTAQAKMRDVVSVKDFGAVGDGVTDDTTALANAVATGSDVYVPRVTTPASQYYSTTAAIALNSNQRIFGDGWGSLIRVTGSTTINVIEANTKDRVIVDGLHIYAGGGRSSGSDGCGVFLTDCTKSAVKNCYIENPGSAGIMLYDTNDSAVSGNTILAGAGAVPIQEVDIFIRAASNRNVIYGNHCISSGDSAIAVQTVTAGDTANDNSIYGNIVDTYARYGIYLYRGNAGDSVLRNKIFGNSIRNITGAASDDGGATKPYGVGVYVQGAEYSVVADNTIDTVCTQTNSDTLAPGGIGSTNVTNVVITGNHVSNSTREGITVRDPNGSGAATGSAVIANNNVVTVTRAGIQVDERGRVSINGNYVEAVTRGVYISNATANDPLISVTNNTIRTTSHNAVDIEFVKGLIVSGNNIFGNALAGIIVGNCDQVSITGNTCVNGTAAAGSIGIRVSSTVADGCILSGNTCTDNVSGMIIDANTRIGDNKVFGNTTDWSGNYAVLRGAYSVSTVGVTNAGGEQDLKTFTFPASAFNVNAQSIRVTAWGTTLNNSNPKTVKFYFGSNNTLSFALTVSQISPWKIVAEISRSGSSTQSATATIIQGGTTTATATATASPAETDTAAITIKCTGTVTDGGGGLNANDITQTGLRVEFIDS